MTRQSAHLTNPSTPAQAPSHNALYPPPIFAHSVHVPRHATNLTPIITEVAHPASVERSPVPHPFSRFSPPGALFHTLPNLTTPHPTRLFLRPTSTTCNTFLVFPLPPLYPRPSRYPSRSKHPTVMISHFHDQLTSPSSSLLGPVFSCSLVPPPSPHHSPLNLLHLPAPCSPFPPCPPYIPHPPTHAPTHPITTL